MNDPNGSEKVIDFELARKKFQSQKIPPNRLQKLLDAGGRFVMKNTSLVHKVQLLLFLGLAAYILQLCGKA